ncbi:hypothetical protein B0J14DRAFT_478246, partial [Halenospora varia]
HLDLLIKHISQAYTSTAQCLGELRESGEITYDLLWALFKPNTVAYTTCHGTKKPRCIKYDFGEEKTMSDGTEYFHIEGRYLDFDGKVFGEASVATGIVKFRGSKPINSLDVFPLKCHQNEKKIKEDLIVCGRKFYALTGVSHRHYNGMAFQMKKGMPVMISIDSRIIIDAAFFRQINPNYTRPSITSAANYRSDNSGWVIIGDLSDSPADKDKIKSVDHDELKEDDFLLCSPTVLGFSLEDKLWLEFAVADITEIRWNPLLLDHLAINPKRKKLIKALTMSHMSQALDHCFDDFVAGKGRGLILLF